MQRLALPLLLLLSLALVGCAGHSARHSSRGKLSSCPSFPCGGTVYNDDMTLAWEIERTPSDGFVLSGTLAPRRLPEGTPVDMAVLGFDLARDLTLFDSFSFPIVGRDLKTPIPFRHRFTPSSGFDGIQFTWDIRYQE